MDNNVPCIPRPISQIPALPSPNDKPVIDCKNPCDYVCSKYTFGSPLFNDYFRLPTPCPDLKQN